MLRTPEEIRARSQAEIDAGEKLGHTQKIEGVTMDDTCTCGWKSTSYWDGADLAYAEWIDHIKEQGAVITYPCEQSEAT